MNNKIASDTAKSAQSLAQKIAQQMAREPIEVLKDIKEQTTGDTFGPPEKSDQNQPTSGQTTSAEQGKIIDKQKSTRLIEALNRELADIHKQKIFNELQRRIAEGEEIPLNEYPELSMEQKQVLLAQMEAVKKQRAVRATDFSDVPAVHSKPSRRFGAGQKSQAQKEQTHVEKPVPPSG